MSHPSYICHMCGSVKDGEVETVISSDYTLYICSEIRELTHNYPLLSGGMLEAQATGAFFVLQFIWLTN